MQMHGPIILASSNELKYILDFSKLLCGHPETFLGYIFVVKFIDISHKQIRRNGYSFSQITRNTSWLLYVEQLEKRDFNIGWNAIV